MSLEAIQLLTETENALRSEKAEAAAKAKKRISDEHANGERMILLAEEKAARELDELAKAVETQAGQNADELANAILAKKKEMELHAVSRMDTAVALIVERIVSG